MLPAATYNAGEWRVDVNVIADEPSIMLGEPTWLSFSVTNLTNEPLQILVGGDDYNELGRPSSFAVRAVGHDGGWVAVPEAAHGRRGLIGPKDLPPRGSYVFRLFVPHWAKFSEAGIYDLICRRSLQLLRPAADGAFMKQPITEIEVEARTKLVVVARDSARMQDLIARLGEQMLEANGEKHGDEATVGLAWIDDPRVVPYFVRALRIRSYAMRFIAIQMLGRHGTGEAVAGLTSALALTAADFEGSTEHAAEVAGRIRAAAIGALSRCRQPQAKELLAAHRRDPSERVRESVVLALARMPREQVRPWLEDMLKDVKPAIRAEAERALATPRTPPRAATRK